MTRKQLTILALTLVYFVLLTHSEVPEGKAFPIERFLLLTAGTSFGKVEELLKPNLRHQFTLQAETNTYMCMHFLLANPPGSFYLLFSNSSLLRIIDPTPFVWTNTPWQRPLPVNPQARISSTFRQPALSTQDIAFRFSTYARLKEEGKGQHDVGISVLTTATALRIGPKANAELAQVKKWHAIFNPFHIDVGLTEKNVQDKYGEAMHVINREDGAVIKLYGHVNPPNVPAGVPPALVAVVFNGGRVEAILSHHFLSSDWHKLVSSRK